jgi:hypothetical protein
MRLAAADHVPALLEKIAKEVQEKIVALNKATDR